MLLSGQVHSDYSYGLRYLIQHHNHHESNLHPTESQSGVRVMLRTPKPSSNKNRQRGSNTTLNLDPSTSLLYIRKKMLTSFWKLPELPTYTNSIHTVTLVVFPLCWDVKLTLVSHLIQLPEIHTILPYLDSSKLSQPTKFDGFPTHLTSLSPSCR